jgi:uncharacterized protein (DUF302 family)
MVYYTRKLRMPFPEVLSGITKNLETQGFSVITSIDLQDIFQKKLGISFRNYKILEVCNARLAYKAVSLESHLGAMLPCNVVVQEHENGEVEISAINPFENIDKTLIKGNVNNLATEVGIRLRAALDYIHREPTALQRDPLTPAAPSING